MRAVTPSVSSRVTTTRGRAKGRLIAHLDDVDERGAKRQATPMRASSILALVLFAATPALAQKAVPYWASLGPGHARMRSGPGREFPATWMYQRAGLPVRVVKVYPNWRKIEDPDGTQGWMQANMISERRTAIVTGGVRELRAAADDGAAVVWRVEPGVVGTIASCTPRWCLFDAGGRSGFVRTDALWGDDGDDGPLKTKR
jgi:SH3-like domain-containing protein